MSPLLESQRCTASALTSHTHTHTQRTLSPAAVNPQQQRQARQGSPLIVGLGQDVTGRRGLTRLLYLWLSNDLRKEVWLRREELHICWGALSSALIWRHFLGVSATQLNTGVLNCSVMLLQYMMADEWTIRTSSPTPHRKTTLPIVLCLTRMFSCILKFITVIFRSSGKNLKLYNAAIILLCSKTFSLCSLYLWSFTYLQ